MAIRDQIKQALREYNLDPLYGKRPDILVDKLEQLFLQELQTANLRYSRPRATAANRSLVTSTRSAQKRLATAHNH